MGQFDDNQRKNLGDYLSGSGTYATQGPQFFQAPNEAQRIAGPTGDTTAFGATISALRITVTVRDGQTVYKLSAVIAPPGGATTVQTTATEGRTQTTGATAQTAAQRQTRPSAEQANPRPGTAAAGTAQQNAAARNLRYPFTLLEIRENDEIPSPPTPLTSTI